VRACVIFNPAAKGQKAERFLRLLDAVAKDCTLKRTRGPGDARRLAAEAVREGFERVIAAGGDGTLNEVLNGLGDVSDGFARACLGVLPLGTVNVFAREIGIPRKPEMAWEQLSQGRETRVDLPCVEFSNQGRTERRYFVQLAGAGLDARAIELVSWPLKKKIGPLAYVIAGLKALFEDLPPITVRAGSRTEVCELALVGNGRRYGGEFALCPNADLRDGLLDLCLFPRANVRTLARCSLPLLLRGTVPAAVVRLLQAPTFTLDSSVPVPFELDGELTGHLPATFSVVPGGLRVLAG